MNKLRFYTKILFILVVFLIYQKFNFLTYQNFEDVKLQLLYQSNLYIEQKPAKIILVWNDLYGQENWGFSRTPYKGFRDMNCYQTNCLVTDDKSKITEADALMFLGDHLGRTIYPNATRPKHQRWVFVEGEAPCGVWMNHFQKWESDFNWTQTYKLDSDIPMLYGDYCRRKQPKPLDVDSIVKPKRKLATWFVSNCKYTSERRFYIKELIKYMPIDIYGSCSFMFNQSNVCRKNETERCLELIGKNYKFYFSFENSLAKDYITEKYFKVLHMNVVPVVRGDGNYSAVGPPYSFINTNDFKTPKDLADYLKYLDKNDNEYLKYLRWKETYKIDRLDKSCWNVEPSWCKLCRMLNNPYEVVSHYKNITKWFGTCRKATDINRNATFIKKKLKRQKKKQKKIQKN